MLLGWAGPALHPFHVGVFRDDPGSRDVGVDFRDLSEPRSRSSGIDRSLGSVDCVLPSDLHFSVIESGVGSVRNVLILRGHLLSRLRLCLVVRSRDDGEDVGADRV